MGPPLPLAAGGPTLCHFGPGEHRACNSLELTSRQNLCRSSIIRGPNSFHLAVKSLLLLSLFSSLSAKNPISSSSSPVSTTCNYRERESQSHPVYTTNVINPIYHTTTNQLLSLTPPTRKRPNTVILEPTTTTTTITTKLLVYYTFTTILYYTTTTTTTTNKAATCN